MWAPADQMMNGINTCICVCLGGQPSYQILAPAYYDQNGQLVMGHNGRGLGTPVRLVSPAPILVNTANGQQGKSWSCCDTHTNELV